MILYFTTILFTFLFVYFPKISPLLWICIFASFFYLNANSWNKNYKGGMSFTCNNNIIIIVIIIYNRVNWLLSEFCQRQKVTLKCEREREIGSPGDIPKQHIVNMQRSILSVNKTDVWMPNNINCKKVVVVLSSNRCCCVNYRYACVSYIFSAAT